MKEIDVFVNEVGKGSKVVTIDNELSSFNAIVEGYFTSTYCGEELKNLGVNMFINDIGKITDAPPTYALVDGRDNVVDTIVGNVVFVAHDNEGETISLTDEQIDYLVEIHRKWCTLYSSGALYEVVAIRI